MSNRAAVAVDPTLLDIVACECGASLEASGDVARCRRCGRTLPIRDGILLSPLPAIDGDTQARWNDEHARADEEHDDVFVRVAVTLIREHWPPRRGERFLEFGCGTMRIGAALADQGAAAAGVDFSLSALLTARSRLEQLGHPVRLVHADIRATPFRDAIFDAVYGGGVIEHTRDLDAVLRELWRITKPGGVTINTVPYLSLGALTYRQIWGNVPSLPVLRQIAEIVHIRALGGRHLRFGYERSYPAYALRSAFRRAGFVDVAVRHFDVPLVFEYLPGDRVKALARRLARFRLFWPMVYVVAYKPAVPDGRG